MGRSGCILWATESSVRTAKPKRVHQLGDGVVDLGVVVVGAAGQHDAVGVVLLDPPQGLVALAVHGAVEVHVSLPKRR